MAVLTFLVGLTLGLQTSAATATQQTGVVVAATERFELRSDPRAALHHFLIDWASADAGEWPPYAPQLGERDDWTSVLEPHERRVWSAALETYAATHRRSLLFDESLLAVRDWAAGAGSRDAVPSSDRPLADALERALPIFERHWWAAHDARNRAWIESVAPALAAIEKTMIARFDAAYGGSWPDEILPVDVMVYANAVGAYSAGGRLTISSVPYGNQMPYALEMVFHEASHTDPLEGPLRAGLTEAFERVGAEEPDRFWHDVIFFTSGEITRLVLEDRGEPGYQHYGTLGVYRRGERWKEQLPAFEAYWRPFLESLSQDDDARREAMKALVSQLFVKDE